MGTSGERESGCEREGDGEGESGCEGEDDGDGERGDGDGGRECGRGRV